MLYKHYPELLGMKDELDRATALCIECYKRGGKRSVTQEFYAYLEAQPLLKAILAGHLHMTVADRFSPTAFEYVVGGNFLFGGQEITIS